MDAYLKLLAKQDFRQTLDFIQTAAGLLQNPQYHYKTIHIAGTNGKGSTAAFLESILRSLGYKVGLMTSPHLMNVTERIQINRENISPKELWQIIDSIRKILPQENFLSYFEMITLAGFEYFRRKEVDIAIIEVGMGGRFDATNIVKPDVGVLTSISKDHEAYLGNSLEQIAKEKCGILKREMNVVSAPQEKDVQKVIEEHCSSLNIDLIWANPENISYELGLHGEHQKINAACALEAAKNFCSEEDLDSMTSVAFQKTDWPGRLQYLSTKPQLLVDGAHNVAGMQTLVAHLKKEHSHQKIHCVTGVLSDKDYKPMFELLAPMVEQFFCMTPKSERALEASILEKYLKSLGKKTLVFQESIAEAFTKVISQINPHDLLVATGSLYMVGELLCSLKPV